jgi:PAS domain S-box-containing protein
VSSGGVRVLLVEDDEDDHIITRELLTKAARGPYHLEWARSYDEGLEALRRGGHDLVLVDYRLGARTGLELVRDAVAAGTAAPFVMLTGQGDQQADLDAMRLGVADYLEKAGLTPVLLERSIRHALERARIVAELEAHARRQAAIAELGQRALSGIGLGELFDDALARLTRLLGVELAKLLELNAERSQLTLRAGVGWGDSFTMGVGVTASQSGYTLTRHEPVVVEDFATERRFKMPEHILAQRVASGMTVLVGSVERPWGVLGVHSRRARRFSASDVNFLQGVANVLASAIERERTERRERDSRARFEAVFAGALDAILIADDRGRYLEANPAATELLGLTRDELLERTVSDIVPPEDRESIDANFRRFLGDGAVRLEKTIVRPDGTRRQVEFAARANIASGQHLAVLRDMTPRKQLEEQLRHSQKMEAVGRLAGGVAHDYNNVLTAINGYAELLMAGLRAGDPLRKHAEEILKAGSRAAALTHQLLAFSRKQILQPRVLDPNGVVSNMESMLRRLVGEDVELTASLAPDVGRIRADPGQLEQVIMNLVVNARDAMPRGGTVTIETANVEFDRKYVERRTEVQPGRYVLIAVTDTGCGMDAATLEHLFEPFFTTKEQGKGTGLGLSTVYGIVKQSSGHIWVYSEPGRATTFKIYFPRVDAPPDAPPAPAPVGPVSGHEVVLVVEDHEFVRALATAVLGQCGYTVLEAANGGEALLICEKHEGPIHLMITDVVMPKMSGPELVERVRPIRPELRILYTSGYTDNAIVHHGALDEGTPFLQKPFSPRALAEKVRELLDAP